MSGPVEHRDISSIMTKIENQKYHLNLWKFLDICYVQYFWQYLSPNFEKKSLNVKNFSEPNWRSFFQSYKYSLAISRFAIIEKNIFVVTAPTINSPITHTNTQWESRHQMKGLITFSQIVMCFSNMFRKSTTETRFLL